MLLPSFPPSLFAVTTGPPQPMPIALSDDIGVDPAYVWLGPQSGRPSDDDGPSVTVDSVPLLLETDDLEADVVSGDDTERVMLSFEWCSMTPISLLCSLSSIL